MLTGEPLGKRLSLLSIMQPSGSSSRLARGHASPHAYDDLLDQQVRPARSDLSSPSRDHFELHPFGSRSEHSHRGRSWRVGRQLG